MYKYKLYYDGGFLKDSMELECFDMGESFEAEEEAREEAEMEIESRIEDWESDEVEYDRDLFEIIIEEV